MAANGHATRAGRRVRSALRRPVSVLLSVAWLLLVLVVTLGAQLFQPHGFDEINLLHRLSPPVPLEGSTWSHPLGTDRLGRDRFSRLLVATQVSIGLALLGTVIGTAIGIALGLLAAHAGGMTDEAIGAAIDFQAAMPYYIVALAILAFMGNAFGIFLFLMGIYGWERFARITRGLVLSAREEGYALAFEALGSTPRRLYLRHLLPNISATLIVQMTINFPETILFETSLSFLGLGIQPPLTSLGQMLGEGRNYMNQAWWLAVFPGSVIFLTTLAASILGDWLRHRLDM